jgi:antirestriction protein ArdC
MAWPRKTKGARNGPDATGGGNTGPGSDFLRNRQETTERLCELILEGNAPWQKPWVPGPVRVPFNPVSKTTYRGYNRVSLSLLGYRDPRWVSFLQAAQKGWRIKNGAKAQPIEFWQWSSKRRVLDKNGNPVRDPNGDPIEHNVSYARPLFKRFHVFNGSQVETLDGGPLPDPEPLVVAWDPVQAAEELIQASGARINHDRNDRCFYDLVDDSISMPPKGLFPSAENYYSSLLHELAHWTRHPGRMDREKIHGGRGYAREELRAEIASWMLCQDLGLSFSPENAAAYCQSWVKDLSEDPSEIARACSDAEKIKNFLLAPVPHLAPAPAADKAGPARPARVRPYWPDLPRPETVLAEAALAPPAPARAELDLDEGLAPTLGLGLVLTTDPVDDDGPEEIALSPFPGGGPGEAGQVPFPTGGAVPPPPDPSREPMIPLGPVAQASGLAPGSPAGPSPGAPPSPGRPPGGYVPGVTDGPEGPGPGLTDPPAWPGEGRKRPERPALNSPWLGDDPVGPEITRNHMFDDPWYARRSDPHARLFDRGGDRGKADSVKSVMDSLRNIEEWSSMKKETLVGTLGAINADYYSRSITPNPFDGLGPSEEEIKTMHQNANGRDPEGPGQRDEDRTDRDPTGMGQDQEETETRLADSGQADTGPAETGQRPDDAAGTDPPKIEPRETFTIEPDPPEEEEDMETLMREMAEDRAMLDAMLGEKATMAEPKLPPENDPTWFLEPDVAPAVRDGAIRKAFPWRDDIDPEDMPDEGGEDAPPKVRKKKRRRPHPEDGVAKAKAGEAPTADPGSAPAPGAKAGQEMPAPAKWGDPGYREVIRIGDSVLTRFVPPDHKENLEPEDLREIEEIPPADEILPPFQVPGADFRADTRGPRATFRMIGDPSRSPEGMIPASWDWRDHYSDPDYWEAHGRLEDMMGPGAYENVTFDELRLKTANRIVISLSRPGLAMSGVSRWDKVKGICVDALGTAWAGEERFSQFLRETKRVCDYQINLCRAFQGRDKPGDWARREVSVNNSLLLIIDAGKQLEYPGFVFPRYRPMERPYDYVPLIAKKPDESSEGRIVTLAGIEFKEFRIASPDETPRGYGVMRRGTSELINIFKCEQCANDFAYSLGRPDTPMLRKFQDQEFMAQFSKRLSISEGLPKDNLPTDSALAELNQRLIERGKLRAKGEEPKEPLFTEDNPVFPPFVPPKDKPRLKDDPDGPAPKPGPKRDDRDGEAPRPPRNRPTMR